MSLSPAIPAGYHFAFFEVLTVSAPAIVTIGTIHTPIALQSCGRVCI